MEVLIDMQINRAYKFRMYPNEEQKEIINKTIGCSRFIYNMMLERKKDNPKLSILEMIKEIPKLYKEYPFLKEVDSNSLRCSLFNLDTALKRYQHNASDYPKFKVKGFKDKCCISYYQENIKLDMKNKEKKIFP